MKGTTKVKINKVLNIALPTTLALDLATAACSVVFAVKSKNIKSSVDNNENLTEQQTQQLLVDEQTMNDLSDGCVYGAVAGGAIFAFLYTADRICNKNDQEEENENNKSL